MAMASWRNEQTGRPAKKHFGHFQSPSGKSIINGNQIYNTPEVFEYITIYQYSKLEHHHISPSGNLGKSTNEKNGPFSHQYQSAIFH